MEFSEIGEKLGGLTADQVFTLATYGKDILNIAGIHLMALNLVNIATAVLISDDIDAASYKDEISCLLQVAKRTEELTDECWYLRKTPLGLTGVDFDNCRFKLGAVNELSEVETK